MDSPRVLRSMLRDRRVMLTVGVVACFATVQNVYGTFWPLLVDGQAGHRHGGIFQCFLR